MNNVNQCYDKGFCTVAPKPWGPREHVPPTLPLWEGTGGTICSCTAGKTSNWRVIILNRNYPEFHRLTWQAACVHLIYLFFETRLQRLQADFLRQHNHNQGHREFPFWNCKIPPLWQKFPRFFCYRHLGLQNMNKFVLQTVIRTFRTPTLIF